MLQPPRTDPTLCSFTVDVKSRCSDCVFTTSFLFCKYSLISYGQQFHKCQQNEQSPLTSQLNGIPTVPS